MLSPILRLRLASLLALTLLVAAPAQAAWQQVDPQSELEGRHAGPSPDRVEVVNGLTSAPPPAGKPKSKRQKRISTKSTPKASSAPAAASPTPSLSPKPKLGLLEILLSHWRLGLVTALAFVVGIAVFQVWRAFRREAITATDLERRRQGAEALVRRFTRENQGLKNRAVDVEDRCQRLAATNESLRVRAEAAEKEAHRLRVELDLAALQGQVDEITRNRTQGPLEDDRDEDLDDLEMESSELPNDPAEQARLEKEAGWLKERLALLRKTGKRKARAIVPQDVLNGEEQVIFWTALAWAKDNKLNIYPQVSMGEFLTASKGGLRTLVFRTFNARRVDFLISDRDWKPMLAIEHQGSGHRQGNWRLHDAIKRQVLRIAGVPLVETVKGEGRAVIHARLDAALVRAKARLESEPGAQSV